VAATLKTYISNRFYSCQNTWQQS